MHDDNDDWTPPPRRRHTVIVTINADMVPGFNHTPESFQEWLQSHLDYAVGHYDPRVEIVSPVTTEAS